MNRVIFGGTHEWSSWQGGLISHAHSGVWLPESMLCQFHIDWLISTGLPLACRKYEVKRGGWQTRPDLLFTKIHARLFTN